MWQRNGQRRQCCQLDSQMRVLVARVRCTVRRPASADPAEDGELLIIQGISQVHPLIVPNG
jgi:hypothetical protein